MYNNYMINFNLKLQPTYCKYLKEWNKINEN